MIRVVLDTNVLLAILPTRSPYRLIWDKLLSGGYQIAVSTEILLEYHEVLSQKTSINVAENVLRLITELPNAEFQQIHYHFNLIATDPDDNKFVDCAIAANVRYIVSNDNHFNILKQIMFPKVECVRIEVFLEECMKIRD